MKICPQCEEGELIPVSAVKVEMEEETITLKGEKCNKCNEEFPDEAELDRVMGN